MITAVWEGAFWGLFGLFWCGVLGALVMIVWRASRYTYRLHLRRKRWETRRSRILLLRTVNDPDWQSRVLRAVRRMDEIDEIRAEILEGSKEPHLVGL